MLYLKYMKSILKCVLSFFILFSTIDLSVINLFDKFYSDMGNKTSISEIIEIECDLFYHAKNVVTTVCNNIAKDVEFLLAPAQANKMFVDIDYPFVIDSVMPDSRAMRAGLMKGDRFVTYIDTSCHDSVKKANVFSMISMFDKSKNIPIPVTVRRNDTLTQLLITPDVNGKIGVVMKGPGAFYEYKSIKYGLLESVSVGVKRGFGRLFNYVGDMKYVFSPAGAKSVGGFVTIGSLFPYPFNARIFWEITAFLSVILAFMNILPIPALDGGHVMFLAYEVITKKKPSQNVMVKAQIIGMAILLALVLYANLNDVFRAL